MLLGAETSQFINMRLTEYGYFLNLSKDLVTGLHSSISSRWESILASHTLASEPASVEWLVHPGGKGTTSIVLVAAAVFISPIS